jgi:hypothetical protein
VSNLSLAQGAMALVPRVEPRRSGSRRKSSDCRRPPGC